MEVPHSVQGKTRAPKSSHRKWTVVENEILVTAMVELHNKRTYNADCGFRSGYLQKLEQMLAVRIPGGGIKAKPHIESRLRTLKKDWSIVYDMVSGRNTSGFGWNPVRRMVTAEKEVWDAYVLSHPNAAVFMYKTFPYMDEFMLVFGKDRATGEDAQTAADVIEEIQREEETGQNVDGEILVEDRVGESSQQQSASCSGSKRKRSAVVEGSSALVATAINNFDKGMKKLQRSMSRAVTHLSINPARKDVENLHDFLKGIEGISPSKMKVALLKLPRQKDNLVLLYKLPAEDRLDYMRSLIDE